MFSGLFSALPAILSDFEFEFRFKGLCKDRAQKAGLATARLPIKKYIELDSRAVLTVNHVVQIMVEMYNR